LSSIPLRQNFQNHKFHFSFIGPLPWGEHWLRVVFLGFYFYEEIMNIEGSPFQPSLHLIFWMTKINRFEPDISLLFCSTTDKIYPLVKGERHPFH